MSFPYSENVVYTGLILGLIVETVITGIVLPYHQIRYTLFMTGNLQLFILWLQSNSAALLEGLIYFVYKR